MKTNEYLKQANDFLQSTNSVLTIEFLKNDYHFDTDKEKRDIYKCTLQRGSRKYVFNYSNSLKDSGFYFTVGRKRYDLDRKYLDSKNLTFICKQLNTGFTPTCKADIIHKPIKPNSYDILARLQKYDYGTFEDFCNEFGYNSDSRRAEKIYKAFCDEYNSLCSLYNESELELLQDIQ